MRHAKSAWDDPSLDDYDRPLAPRGFSDATTMAKWLVTQKTGIDLILSSSAKRAAQTTELLCKNMGIDAAKIAWQRPLYHADTDTLLSAISRVPINTGRVMLVGHNPGLDELLLLLCSGQPPVTKEGKLLTTAAIAILTLPYGWSAIQSHSCRLAQLVRPKELPQQ